MLFVDLWQSPIVGLLHYETCLTVLSSNQFTSLEQVNQSILTVEDATQKNAALVEEASAAASELHDQTEKLRETIKQFKV